MLSKKRIKCKLLATRALSARRQYLLEGYGRIDDSGIVFAAEFRLHAERLILSLEVFALPPAE